MTTLDKGPYAKEVTLALDAAREAARLCRTVQAAIGDGVLEKSDRSPVTVADFGSQALICRRLLANFPADPVIGEENSAVLRQPESSALLARVTSEVNTILPATESDAICSWIDHGSARDYSNRFWTLDPIDVTKGFLRGEQYAIALALIVDGQVVAGVLGCPNLDPDGVLLAAVRGQGTFVSSLKPGSELQPAAVTRTNRSSEARFVESVESGHSSHSDSARIAADLGIEWPPVRMDSQAKYGALARGDADIYLRLPTRPGYVEKIWDHAAGAIVIEEAGGRVTDIEGRPLEFQHGSRLEANRGIVASNGLLHDQVLKTLPAGLE
jgi:3'(2'), 5'-bisphosphate nucleotidase